MNFFTNFFRFAHPYALIFSVSLFCVALVFRTMFWKPKRYRYSLVEYLASANVSVSGLRRSVLFVFRFSALLLLVFLVGKPQLVDQNSQVHVEGVDIMVVLDVSASMHDYDDPKDRRRRIDIAKTEASRFVEKRKSDPIGIVIFGNEAVSVCPLTLDKKVVQEKIDGLEIGIVDYSGTVISTALVTAINRLKQSKSKNKIIVLLTDGMPSAGDIRPELALDIAKASGVKVYTIGIGPGEVRRDVYCGVVMSRTIGLDRNLLKKIATETGGMFFESKSADDMRKIYETIDGLEKTEFETQVFTRYKDIFLPFLLVLVGILLLDVLLTSLIWRGL